MIYAVNHKDNVEPLFSCLYDSVGATVWDVLELQYEMTKAQLESCDYLEHEYDEDKDELRLTHADYTINIYPY